MSSASPPKEPEVEPVTQSGDEAEPMEREHHDIQTQGQGEFEVKEQDRWLPIANGLCSISSLVLFSCLPLSIARSVHLPHTQLDRTAPDLYGHNAHKNQHQPRYTCQHRCLSITRPFSPCRPTLLESSYTRIQSISLILMHCNLESGCSTVQSPEISDITHAHTRPSPASKIPIRSNM